MDSAAPDEFLQIDNTAAQLRALGDAVTPDRTGRQERRGVVPREVKLVRKSTGYEKAETPLTGTAFDRLRGRRREAISNRCKNLLSANGDDHTGGVPDVYDAQLRVAGKGTSASLLRSRW